MNFRFLCEFFERVKETRGIPNKKKLITERMDEFREIAKMKSEAESYEVLFNIIRLIVPKLDKERSTYNMKEARISKAIIKMLSLPNGKEKTTLTRAYQESGIGTEFSEIVYSVLRKYIHKNSDMTVLELNKLLEQLTQRQSDTEIDEMLLNIFKKASSEDSRWIIKIILRELRLGIDADKILTCYHPDALNLYTTNNNLRVIVETLFDRKVKLNEIEIKIFAPFRPMLSKRVDPKTFKNELLEGKEFIIENKFDGERFQMHMQGNIYRWFSRNSFDYTHSFGSTYEAGTFTEKLKGVFDEDITRIILDGEMMLYNKYRKEYGSKGMTLDVKKLSSTGPYQPCFVIYDLLMINDTVLTSKPLSERLTILKECLVKPIPGTIVISKHLNTSSQQEIVNALNASMDREEEGIIVKDPESTYRCGQRVYGWYKLKIEYFSGDVMNDLDLVLMGGCYSSSDADKLNTFIVGLRSDTTYISFGKVSVGLNYEQISMLDDKIKTLGYSFDEFEARNNGRMAFAKETPSYWIEPEHSVIFVVRATELIRSGDKIYKTPYTLRFPRVLAIRDDKPIDECLNINELLDLSEQNKPVIKLNKRYVTLEEVMRVMPRVTKKRKFILPRMIKLEQKLEILKEYTIFVLNGHRDYTEDIIQSILKQAGATLAYKLKDNIDIVLVGTYNEQVKELIQTPHRYDYIGTSWLFRIIENRELSGYESEDVYSLGHNHKNNLCGKLDRFGDNNFETTNVEILRKTLKLISDHKCSINMNHTWFKRKCLDKYIAYFDKYEIINNKRSNMIHTSLIDEFEFSFNRGNICDKINKNTNLVICYIPERIELVKNYLRSGSFKNVDVKMNDFLYNEL